MGSWLQQRLNWLENWDVMGCFSRLTSQVEIESLFSLIKMFLCSSFFDPAVLLMVRKDKYIPRAGKDAPSCFWRSCARGPSGLWVPLLPCLQPRCQQTCHAAHEHQQGSHVSFIASKYWEEHVRSTNPQTGSACDQAAPCRYGTGSFEVGRALLTCCHSVPHPRSGSPSPEPTPGRARH